MQSKEFRRGLYIFKGVSRVDERDSSSYLLPEDLKRRPKVKPNSSNLLTAGNGFIFYFGFADPVVIHARHFNASGHKV